MRSPFSSNFRSDVQRNESTVAFSRPFPGPITRSQQHGSTPRKSTGTPHRETPSSATHHRETPGSATPHRETPSSATPHRETPGSATPHKATPGSGTTPRKPSPHRTTPSFATPRKPSRPLHETTPSSGPTLRKPTPRKVTPSSEPMNRKPTPHEAAPSSGPTTRKPTPHKMALSSPSVGSISPSTPSSAKRRKIQLEPDADASNGRPSNPPAREPTSSGTGTPKLCKRSLFDETENLNKTPSENNVATNAFYYTTPTYKLPNSVFDSIERENGAASQQRTKSPQFRGISNKNKPNPNSGTDSDKKVNKRRRTLLDYYDKRNLI